MRHAGFSIYGSAHLLLGCSTAPLYIPSDHTVRWICFLKAEEFGEGQFNFNSYPFSVFSTLVVIF